ISVEMGATRRFTRDDEIRPETDFDLTVRLGGFGAASDGTGTAARRWCLRWAPGDISRGFLMRRLLPCLALAATVALGAPLAAAAQDFSPVVYVNNSAVTRYELDQRVRFMQVLRSPEQGAAVAETQLIEDRLR